MAVMAPTIIANGGSASNGMTVSVWKKSSRSNERVMKINASPFFFLLFFLFLLRRVLILTLAIGSLEKNQKKRIEITPHRRL